MPDFENNPVFNSQIQKLDPNHSVAFTFQWDQGSKQWVPNTGASIQVENLELNLEPSDVNTHRILSGISGELSNLDGTSSDEETHKLLSGISGVLGSTSSEDVKTHELLSGISGVLENADSEDVKTHELLSGISGVLGEMLATEDLETHRLLGGISGVIETTSEEIQTTLNTGIGHTHIMINQTHTHLQDIEVSLDELKESNQTDAEKIRDQQEIQIQKQQEQIDVKNLILEELEDANLLGQDQLELTSGVLDSSEEIEDLIEGSNEWLSGISGTLEKLNIEIGADPITHKLLSGISGHNELHYIENERNLRNINVNTEQSNLTLEELKGNFRDLTFYTKKFEEEGMVQETTIDYEELEEPTLYDKVFNNVTFNGRYHSNKTPELSQEILVTEDFKGDTNTTDDRVYIFDEIMPHSIRTEDYKGDLNGYQSLFPFPKKIGSDDKVTIYNDSPFPLEVFFRGGEDDFKLHEGQKIELTKDEAYQTFLRRQYTISGFEVRYSIERMYTPEENIFNEKDAHIMKPEQTHSRLGLGSIVADNTYVYVAYGNGWKRMAIAAWEHCTRRGARAFQLDYFDTYVENQWLCIKQEVDRRIPLADWAYTSQIPMQGHNNFWADKYFIYLKHAGGSVKVGGDKGKDEWRRYALAEFTK